MRNYIGIGETNRNPFDKNLSPFSNNTIHNPFAGAQSLDVTEDFINGEAFGKNSNLIPFDSNTDPDPVSDLGTFNPNKKPLDR